MAAINLDNLNLSDDEALDFELEADSTEQNDINLCLVGSFVHDRPINFYSMKTRLTDVWRPVKSMAVTKATHGLYIFKFFHHMDVEAVIKGGPWTFDNFTLIIDRLKVGVALHDIPLFHVNFWVQVHHVPVGMMVEKYMRVRVRVDVRNPLKIEKKINLIGGGGELVKFKYERLGSFCFVCGILGHSENKCEVKYAMARDDGRRSWSNEIRAEIRRPGGRFESRWLRKDSNINLSAAANEQSGERDQQHTSPIHSEPRQSRGSEERRESSEADNSLIITSNDDRNCSLSRSTVVRRLNATHVSHTVVFPHSLLLAHQPHVSGEDMLTEVPQSTEVPRVENDDMVNQVERKRRRAELSIGTITGFDSCLAIDVEGRSGGLAVLWKDSKRSRRRQAWDLLRELGNMSLLPWCIIGDFNDLLSHEDKKGIHPHPNWLCMGFREAISDYDLSDIPLEGHPFTWIKSRGTNHVIEERLDRAMTNLSWLGLFPQIVDRVARCANKLQGWGRRKRTKFKEEIDARVREMELLRGNQGETDSRRYQELYDRHAILVIQEEGYWKQRAKMHWLKEGDLNTRFFHMSATVRSKKKKLSKLIDDGGTEVHTQDGLCGVAKKYFDSLFKARDGDHEPVLNLIQQRVTEEDNNFLIAPITKDEINMHCSKCILTSHRALMGSIRPFIRGSGSNVEQSAFVEGRSILDNALIVIEVIHALKRKTKGRRGELALKIDISKAYDKVDWGFLRGVLSRMGFCVQWIDWMMMCVSSVNYAMLMNFDRVGPITPERDDCFLFCMANFTEVNQLLRILHTYEQASGQEINLSKSEVFISRNLSHADKEDLSGILGVRHVLGRALSKAGKEVMIKSVLQAIPSYVMRGSNNGRGIHWLAWERLACPKAKGGLGFCNFQAFNMAMVAKQVWHIVQNPDSMVAKVIKARWSIGGGDKINIMKDPWLRGSDERWVPSPQEEGVYQLFVNDLLLDNYKAWDIAKI
ncbi:ribonuclease H [Trifolium pratense]|uniref:Ribonuclease H n=1 Tax=Trifolium pratense TaxID=57577 RepID=A0A2K3MP39_TRIPR|nr:ribonuclease H [Trifolium pratense]